MSVAWIYHDAAKLIPVDLDAERTVAGIAIVSGTQARAIVEATAPKSFHDQQLNEIVMVAAELPVDLVDGADQWARAEAEGDHRLVAQGAEVRANAIATITGIELSFIIKLAVGRSAIRFTDGLRERLDHAALARDANARMVARLEQNGVDVGWLTELDDRLNSIAMALLAAATGVGALIGGEGSEADVIDALLQAGLYVGVGRDEIAEAVLAATQGEEQ
jgi:hypothetical protein